MKKLKRLLKIAGLTIVFFIAFIGLYFLAAYSLSRITVDRQQEGVDEVLIYILSNGVHTDLVVPVNTSVFDWRHDIKFDNTLAKDTLANLVAFGWGDKGFYLQTPTWADLKFSVAFKAAFGLNTSAIHATFYKTLHEDENCKRIKISTTQYQRLVNYIRGSLILDENNKAIGINTNANYSKDNAFYEASGRYSLFHTFNTWANNGLKACGQKACLWTPFDTGILNQYTNK